MAATPEQIAQLRRMVAEPTPAIYSDVALAGYIERYACVDERGALPYTLDASTRPPTYVANAGWALTYDLNAAAADLWAEKAAALAADFDFTADGAGYHRSQAYRQAMAHSRHYAARRRPGHARVHVYSGSEEAAD